MNLANGTSLFVKRGTKPPPQRPARVRGKFERLLGDETTRVMFRFCCVLGFWFSYTKEDFILMKMSR